LLIILFPLSQVLPLVILLSIFLVYVQFKIIKHLSLVRLLLLLLFIFLFFFIFKDYIDSVNYRLERIIDDKVLLDDSAKSNVLLGFFNFLFGPGLIRPLFPSKYYLVYTYYFAFLTWLACISWFFQFSLTISIFLNKKMNLNYSKNFFFFLYTFLIYLSVYVTTFGGPGGLRKRMVAYFLFSLCTKEALSKSNFFPLSKNILQITSLIIIIIIIGTSVIGI
jgi:hypothetical protein